MECHQSQLLIPSYLDGELSEAQAAPLRRHLLDCQPCRAGAQGEKNLKRWFSAPLPVTVPKGFAARVARRAFAGDTGEPPAVPAMIVPVGTRPSLAGSGALLRSGARSAERGIPSEDRILRFVLQVTAAAALVVIALSVALRSLSLPAGTSLRAADGRNEIGVEQALERLEQLNRQEGNGAPIPPPPALGRRDRSREFQSSQAVKRLRFWIALLALVSFAAGGAAGTLAAAAAFRPRPETGPFTAYERELARKFRLSPERAELLHVLIQGYKRDMERIQASHMARSLSAMEPELANIGRLLEEQIRDKVLPPDRRREFESPELVSSWTPPR